MSDWKYEPVIMVYHEKHFLFNEFFYLYPLQELPLAIFHL